jgi:hypothetical protein
MYGDDYVGHDESGLILNGEHCLASIESLSAPRNCFVNYLEYLAPYCQSYREANDYAYDGSVGGGNVNGNVNGYDYPGSDRVVNGCVDSDAGGVGDEMNCKRIEFFQQTIFCTSLDLVWN